MIVIRRARLADAPAIGAVHVASWRSAYAGILPDDFLASLSVGRQAAYYERVIQDRGFVHVACASGPDLPGAAGARVVGFASSGRARMRAIAEGEIETLYLLDDWREQGIGRRLIAASAAALAASGCRSAMVWVLRENPSRWFYEHIGGRTAAESEIRVGGAPVMQTALVWNPIDRLLASAAQQK